MGRCCLSNSQQVTLREGAGERIQKCRSKKQKVTVGGQEATQSHWKCQTNQSFKTIRKKQEIRDETFGPWPNSFIYYQLTI
jgi:hypothetical protein